MTPLRLPPLLIPALRTPALPARRTAVTRAHRLAATPVPAPTVESLLAPLVVSLTAKGVRVPVDLVDLEAKARPARQEAKATDKAALLAARAMVEVHRVALEVRATGKVGSEAKGLEAVAGEVRAGKGPQALVVKGTPDRQATQALVARNILALQATLAPPAIPDPTTAVAQIRRARPPTPVLLGTLRKFHVRGGQSNGSGEWRWR